MAAKMEIRRWRGIGVAMSGVVALGVLAATGVYLSGAFDDWQDNRSLSSACGGSLDYSELKEVLGVDRLRAKGSGLSDCKVADPGNSETSVAVNIKQGGGGERLLSLIARMDSHKPGQAVTPVGNGWGAILSTDGGTTWAGAYMVCRKPARSGENDAIVVSMQVDPAGPAEPLSADRRAGLARSLTGTLGKLADKRGCEGTPRGNWIARLPEDSTKNLKRAGEAVGTCRGVASASYESAADGTAPIEDCFLADERGRKRFRLAAYYGPYAKSARRETLVGADIRRPTGGGEGAYWTTASCSSGQALYTVENLHYADVTIAPDSPQEKQALKTFAVNSAKRHGCSPPEW
ncbi:hypothetical protein [Streptomyces caatingaensis]|uniref:hypothetical protein n=1 Tax=Streptomyces caatingaensis TaxID=1678637 RepID=UPI000AC885DC|nr:hypothetical protein [Streptomyces caatingaensis]